MWGRGHTQYFKNKIIPDRRQFDKRINSGSQEIVLAGALGRGLRQVWLSPVPVLNLKHFKP